MLYLCNCLCLQQQSTKKMKVCTDRVRTTRHNIFSECMTEIQEKSILVRVSARFELARVRVIGSRLYVSHISLSLAVKMKGKFPSWRPFYPKFSQQRNIKCLTEEIYGYSSHALKDVDTYISAYIWTYPFWYRATPNHRPGLRNLRQAIN